MNIGKMNIEQLLNYYGNLFTDREAEIMRGGEEIQALWDRINGAKRELLTRYATFERALELMAEDFQKAIKCGNRSYMQSYSVAEVVKRFKQRASDEMDKEPEGEE